MSALTRLARLSLATLASCLLGCPQPDGAAPTPAPAPSAPSAPPAAVAEACARCHALPPADALPRERFLEVIGDMIAMPTPQGVRGLSGDEVEQARAHYGAAAPVRFPRAVLRPALGPDARGRFAREEHSPAPLRERAIPAGGHVELAPLFHERHPDVLVGELRTRAVYALPRWSPQPRHHVLRPLGPTGAQGPPYPCRLRVADLDGDGKRDLVVASLGTQEPSNARQGEVTLLLRRGKEFVRRAAASGLGRVADVAVGDLDGDGDLDLVAGVFGWRGPGQVLALYQEEGLRFRPEVLDERDGCVGLALEDLDGDGRLEVLALLAQEHEVLVAFARGEQGWRARQLYRAPHPAWGFSGLTLCDLDGDGDTDALLSNGDALDHPLVPPHHGLTWLERSGPAEWTPRRLLEGYPGCQRAAAGDLDGDGDLDLVVGSYLPHVATSDEARGIAGLLWLEQRGPGEFTPRVLDEGPCLYSSVAIGDLDADGKPDVAATRYTWVRPDGKSATPAAALLLLRGR